MPFGAVAQLTRCTPHPGIAAPIRRIRAHLARRAILAFEKQALVSTIRANR